MIIIFCYKNKGKITVMSQSERSLKYTQENNSVGNNSPGVPPPPYTYPQQPRDPLKNKKIQNVLIIIIVPLLIFGCYLASPCIISGGWRLESVMFTFDTETELDGALLDELYNNLDADSQNNVTNDTYSLEMAIPNFNYQIQFNYQFEFSGDGTIDLRIENPVPIPVISEFGGNVNDLQIEFQINSIDPDINGITIFPPNNIITGTLTTYSVDSATFWIRSDEAEVDRDDWEHEIIILPFNQRIIGTAELTHPCPF
jgi:hypothetical protein